MKFGQPSEIDPEGERLDDDDFVTMPTDPAEAARSQAQLDDSPISRQNQSVLRDQIRESVLSHGHHRPQSSINRRSTLDADLI